MLKISVVLNSLEAVASSHFCSGGRSALRHLWSSLLICICTSLTAPSDVFIPRCDCSLGCFHLPLRDDSGIMCSVAFAGLMSFQPRRNGKYLRAQWISRLYKESDRFSVASRAEFERRPVLICKDRWQRCFIRYIFHVRHLSKMFGVRNKKKKKRRRSQLSH